MSKLRNKNTEQGFVPIRRGIYDHLRDGQMTGKEWMVYSTLLLKVDYQSGVCPKISGPMLAHLLQIKIRQANRILTSLENKGYIHRLNHRGQIRHYPVVINKYLTVPNGLLIDARNTKSLNEIAWYVETDCLLTDSQMTFNCPANVLQMSRIQDIKTIRIKQDSKKIRGKKPRAPKSFTPPTLEQVKAFVRDNPELANVDPDYFWKVFNESEWIDTKGNPVRNWKLKLRTWSRLDRERKENTKDGTEKIQQGRTFDGLESSIGETIVV